MAMRYMQKEWIVLQCFLSGYGEDCNGDCDVKTDGNKSSVGDHNSQDSGTIYFNTDGCDGHVNMSFFAPARVAGTTIALARQLSRPEDLVSVMAIVLKIVNSVAMGVRAAMDMATETFLRIGTVTGIATAASTLSI